MTPTDEQNIAGDGELDESALAEAMANGDTQAVEVLYDRYSRAVFSFALRILGDRAHAEELLQEVFFRAWRQSHRFSSQRGSFISWLLSITHNMAIDEIRKQNRRPKRADSDDPVRMLGNLSDGDPPVEEQAEIALARDRIRQALTLLPESQRSAIELAYFRGMTQREIAELQGEPLGTVKTRMRLALRKLRDHLDDQGIEPS